LEGTGYQVRPNPIIEQGRIYFDNDRSEEHGLTLFSVNGLAIKELTTRSDFFEINTSDLPAGLYIFRIENNQGADKAAGKLLVAK
jgi:hypothetical protein